MQIKEHNIFSKEINFLGAAISAQSLQTFELPEIAFFGKSNVGKSSLINSLCQRKSLARVSKTPGCTRQINFFSIADKFILADLPGYGYSKVSKQVANDWEKLILHYLDGRTNLLNIMLLIDSRRQLKENDLQIIEIILSYNRDFDLVFTKVDQMGEIIEQDLQNQSLSLLREYNYIPNFFFTSSRNPNSVQKLRDYTQRIISK
jgi:GTP-binding protein